MNKNYGLTNKPNSGKISDEAPSWMNDLFEKLSSGNNQKKAHPFEGIDDPILNPKKIGVNKKND